jgi:hypothetical protein
VVGRIISLGQPGACVLLLSPNSNYPIVQPHLSSMQDTGGLHRLVGQVSTPSLETIEGHEFHKP